MQIEMSSEDKITHLIFCKKIKEILMIIRSKLPFRIPYLMKRRKIMRKNIRRYIVWKIHLSLLILLKLLMNNI